MSTLRNSFFKIAYFLGLHRLFYFGKENTIVLCFHRVSPFPSPGYPPMHPKDFEKLLRYISTKRKIVDFEELEKYSNIPTAIITFDDGFYDFKEYALPIIKRFDIPVTLNIIPSCLDSGSPHWTQKISDLCEVYSSQKRSPILLNTALKSTTAETQSLEAYRILKNHSQTIINEQIAILEKDINWDKKNYTKMLTWLNLKAIISDYSKLFIGNHTYNHVTFGEQHKNEFLNEEILQSHKRIQDQLNIDTNRFAFPNGEFNSTALNYVQDLGYTCIQLTNHSKAKMNHKIFYRIPPIYPTFQENIFKIHGFHEFISRIKK